MTRDWTAEELPADGAKSSMQEVDPGDAEHDWHQIAMQERAKLTALAAGIEGLEKELRESAAYAGYSIDEKRVYTECADELKALRELN